MTIRRWRYRDDVYDRPHTRYNFLATLNRELEEVLNAARMFLRLGLYDLLSVAREFLYPTLSRAAMHRILKRPAGANACSTGTLGPEGQQAGSQGLSGLRT